MDSLEGANFIPEREVFNKISTWIENMLLSGNSNIGVSSLSELIESTEDEDTDFMLKRQEIRDLRDELIKNLSQKNTNVIPSEVNQTLDEYMKAYMKFKEEDNDKYSLASSVKNFCSEGLLYTENNEFTERQQYFMNNVQDYFTKLEIAPYQNRLSIVDFYRGYNGTDSFIKNSFRAAKYSSNLNSECLRLMASPEILKKLTLDDYRGLIMNNANMQSVVHIIDGILDIPDLKKAKSKGDFIEQTSALGKEFLVPMYNVLLNEIEANIKEKVLVLGNIFNFFEEKNDNESEESNIFINLPVDELFGKSLYSCLLNSGLKVLVLWGFSFNAEAEKLLIEGLSKNEELRFLFLKNCTFSNAVFDVIEKKNSLEFFGISCDKANQSEIIISMLKLKQSNPKLIINLVSLESGDFGCEIGRGSYSS